MAAAEPAERTRAGRAYGAGPVRALAQANRDRACDGVRHCACVRARRGRDLRGGRSTFTSATASATATYDVTGAQRSPLRVQARDRRPALDLRDVQLPVGETHVRHARRRRRLRARRAAQRRAASPHGDAELGSVDLLGRSDGRPQRSTGASTRRAGACSSSMPTSASAVSASSAPYDELGMALPRFTRAAEGRVIAGVCAGIAQALGSRRHARPAGLRAARPRGRRGDPALPRALGVRQLDATLVGSAGPRRRRCCCCSALGLSDRAVGGIALVAAGLALAWRQGGTLPARRSALLRRHRARGTRTSCCCSRARAARRRCSPPGAVAGALLLVAGPWLWRLAARARRRAHRADPHRRARRGRRTRARLGAADAGADPATRDRAAARCLARPPAGARAARLALRRPAARGRAARPSSPRSRRPPPTSRSCTASASSSRARATARSTKARRRSCSPRARR